MRACVCMGACAHAHISTTHQIVELLVLVWFCCLLIFCCCWGRDGWGWGGGYVRACVCRCGFFVVVVVVLGRKENKLVILFRCLGNFAQVFCFSLTIVTHCRRQGS